MEKFPGNYRFSLVPRGDKGESRIPWEFQNLLSPLQGHIGAKLYLEGLDMSLHGKIPREFLILLSPPGGLRRIQKIPGIILQKQSLNFFICMSILFFSLPGCGQGGRRPTYWGGLGGRSPPRENKVLKYEQAELGNNHEFLMILLILGGPIILA